MPKDRSKEADAAVAGGTREAVRPAPAGRKPEAEKNADKPRHGPGAAVKRPTSELIGRKH